MRRERARESAAGITGYATDAEHRRGGRRAGRAARGRRPRRRHRRDRARAERRDRPAARPHGHAGRVGRRPAALGARPRRPVVGPRARRRGRPRGALGRGRVRRRRGDGPLPRLLVGAGRHGAPRRPASTTPRCSAGGSPTPPTRTAARPRSPTRPPARRTPTSPRGSSGSTARAPRSRGIATTCPTSPRRRWDDHGPLLALHPRDQRRIEVRGADPRSGATEGAVDRPRRRVGRARAGHARPPGRRTRWSCAPTRDGRRRLVVGGTPVTPDDLHVRAVVDVGDDRVVFTANPIDDATGTSVWRWTDDGRRAAHRRRRRALGGRRRRHGRGPAGVARRPRARRSRSSAVRRIAATVATPLVTPNVTIRHVGARRLATALLLPARHAGRRPPPGAARPLRRAARPARRAGAAGLPDLAVVRRPGLRRGRHRRARHARPRRRRGSAASTATSPARSSRTRSTGCWRWPPRTRASTCRAWRSAAGASAATSPPSPCCAGPTSSTPPSPAPRSPSGASTTPSTPSATSAHPDTDAAAYDACSLLPDADRLERPLLLVHGLADDNVVSAHTLQLSVGAPGRRPPAPGAPAHRRHPHGQPGGRRREPPPVPARLPAGRRSDGSDEPATRAPRWAGA